MIVYETNTTRKKGKYLTTSPQFTSVEGIGQDEDSSFINFMKGLCVELNEIIKRGERFPCSLRSDNKNKRTTTNNDTLVIPVTIALKMALHELMLKRNVNRALLSNLLALTQQDVCSDSWKLEVIRNILPQSKKPDYKKTERLLDINHNSKLSDLEHAFRVLDSSIHFVVRDKFTHSEIFS